MIIIHHIKKIAISLISILIVVISTLFIIAQVNAKQKIPVEVTHVGKDSVGIRLTYQIKEEIRKSSIYKLSNNEIPRYKIMLMTYDIANDISDEQTRRANLNLKSVMAMVFTSLTNKGEFYNGAYLYTIGSMTITRQAEEIIAIIDRDINN